MQTILIVDDEPIIRTLLELVILWTGLDVLTAGLGSETIPISWSGCDEFALPITENTPPGITRWKLAEEILAAVPELSVLLLSRAGTDADDRACGGPQVPARPSLLSAQLSDLRAHLIEKDRREVS